MSDSTNRVGRSAPIDLPAEQFRALGYELVGRIAELLETIQSRPVGPSLSRSDARTLAGQNIRTIGMRGSHACQLTLNASKETHTWVQKAADLTGLGTDAIRWVPVGKDQRMDIDALRRLVEADRIGGNRPFLVIGSAGTVSTGAIDPLNELASFCKHERLWFHVDGAYGAVVTDASGVPNHIPGIRQANSVAVDLHKWLYAPFEACSALVRDPENCARHALITFGTIASAKRQPTWLISAPETRAVSAP